jgi:ribonuclease inhibitor
MRVVELDGQTILVERDVHRILAKELDFGPYYGHNLDALWDVLTTNVERPVLIRWLFADVSRERLGDRFYALAEMLLEVREWDIKMDWQEKFECVLMASDGSEISLESR